MGTTYYLRNAQGDYFDLDKAYGLSRAWYDLSPDHGFALPARSALSEILRDYQPHPCCEEREELVDRLIAFARGEEVEMFADFDSVDEEGTEAWEAAWTRTTGARWTQSAIDHCRSCVADRDEESRDDASRDEARSAVAGDGDAGRDRVGT